MFSLRQQNKPQAVRGFRTLEQKYVKHFGNLLFDDFKKVLDNKARYARLNKFWKGIHNLDNPLSNPIVKKAFDPNTALQDLIDQQNADEMDAEEAMLDDEIDSELDQEDFAQPDLKDFLVPLLTAGFLLSQKQNNKEFSASIQQLAKENNIDLSPSQITANLPKDLPDNIPDFIDQYSTELANSLSNTQKDLVKGFLLKNVTGSSSFDELQGSISDLKDAFDSRATTIARTELARIDTFQTKLWGADQGVSEYEWTCIDPQDFECITACGEIQADGEQFSNGYTEPPVHPNCLCSLTPVLSSDDLEAPASLLDRFLPDINPNQI